MPTLPAVISRPPLDDPPAPVTDPAEFVLRLELSAGLPARIDLDPVRGLVLAVPLGVARAVIAADPAAVLFDSAVANPADLSANRDRLAAWPRLTLALTGAIGETVPVLPRIPVRFGGTGSPAGPGAAAVEVTVDRLVITAGTLRGPGRFGSRLELRWRDLAVAPDAGPPQPQGDPSIPVPFVLPGPEEGLR